MNEAVCVGAQSLSRLTHIPLLWHKDRQGSSHSSSQITLINAEVKKVWVHLTDWLSDWTAAAVYVYPPFSPHTHEHENTHILYTPQHTPFYALVHMCQLVVENLCMQLSLIFLVLFHGDLACSINLLNLSWINSQYFQLKILKRCATIIWGKWHRSYFLCPW